MKSKAQKLREKQYYDAKTKEEKKAIWNSWTRKQQMDAMVNEDAIADIWNKAKSGDKESQDVVNALKSMFK